MMRPCKITDCESDSLRNSPYCFGHYKAAERPFRLRSLPAYTGMGHPDEVLVPGRAIDGDFYHDESTCGMYQLVDGNWHEVIAARAPFADTLAYAESLSEVPVNIQPSFEPLQYAARISAKAQLLVFLRKHFRNTSQILVSRFSGYCEYQMIGWFHFGYPASHAGIRAQLEKVFNIIDSDPDPSGMNRHAIYRVTIVGQKPAFRRSKHIDLRPRTKSHE